jgi:hypothetical protein
MTLATIAPAAPAPVGFRERRRRRARLAERDRSSARLAELHRIADLARRAADLVGSGWVQNAWFAVADEHGRRTGLTGPGLALLADRPVVGGCLVGAVVQAAGGLPAVPTQLVQRTLDLTWHALVAGEGEPVRWRADPVARLARLQELTRWNDDPARVRTDVTGLLRSVERAADREIGRERALSRS